MVAVIWDLVGILNWAVNSRVENTHRWCLVEIYLQFMILRDNIKLYEMKIIWLV